MILKDILNEPYDFIAYRTFEEVDGNKKDVFIGCCEYDGKNLISLDGDTYSFLDEIEKYEVEDDNLIVWVK